MKTNLADRIIERGFYMFVGIIIGICLGSLIAEEEARRVKGLGLICAEKIINNPNVSVDTTYTITRQDTTVSYHFVKR